MFRICVPSVMGTQRFIWSYLLTNEARAALSSAASPEFRMALELGPRIRASALSSPDFAADCKACPASAGVAKVVCAAVPGVSEDFFPEHPVTQTAGRSVRGLSAPSHSDFQFDKLRACDFIFISPVSIPPRAFAFRSVATSRRCPRGGGLYKGKACC